MVTQLKNLLLGLLSVLMVLVIVGDAYSKTIKVVKWDGKTVTKISPTGNIFIIKSASDLAWIALPTTLESNNNFDNKTLRIVNNIDMNNKPFTGIKLFKGKLDGNHKKIYGINIDKSKVDNVGLISTLGAGGSIENLTIAKGSIIKGKGAVGAFVGSVANGATVTIKGVTNHATVTGAGAGDNIGGFIGLSGDNSTLTIDNSSNTGRVEGTGVKTVTILAEEIGETNFDMNVGMDNIGGLVGHSSSGSSTTIMNSSNTGDVTGTGDYIGGLIGNSATNSTLAINSSSNKGLVTGTGTKTKTYYAGEEYESVIGMNCIGGLVGYSSNGSSTKITSSSNTGAVTGSAYLGGLIGRSDAESILTITSSSNTGDLSGEVDVGGLVGDSSTLRIDNGSNTGTVTGTGSYVGGLVGDNSGSLTITNSLNTGDVIGEGLSIGGLLGGSWYSALTIDNSSNRGDVTGKGGTRDVGGLVGKSYYNTFTINNSSNTGAVSGRNKVGGLVGDSDTSSPLTIDNSSNTGRVSGVDNVGGLVGWGYNNYIAISSSLNTGAVLGTNDVGGLIGYSYYSDLTINNSSNTGRVSGADKVGGFVGESNTSLTVAIYSSSNTGDLSGKVFVGGVLGYGSGYGSGAITLLNVHSYAKTVTGTAVDTGEISVGGIVGYISNRITVTAHNVYWLHDRVEGIEKAVGIGVDKFTNTSNKSKALNKRKFAKRGSFKGWDFDTVWEILANGKYPTLRNLPVAPVTTK